MNAKRAVWIVAVTALFGISLALTESAGAAVPAGPGVNAGAGVRPGIPGFGFMHKNPILFPFRPPNVNQGAPVVNRPPTTSRSNAVNQVGGGAVNVDPCGSVAVLMPCAGLGADPMLCGCQPAFP